MRSATCHALLCALLLASACGGGGGGDDDAGVRPRYTLDARIYESLTGTVYNDYPGGDVVNHGLWAVGDTSVNTTRRAFYTFIVDDLPGGAQVERAVFTTRQYLVVGFPFSELGDVVVDHVDTGPILDAPDYAHVQYSLDIGTLSASADLGLRSLDVTGAVRADVQADRGVTTLRLRHRSQTNVDGQRDYSAYSSPDWPEEHRRVSLVVTYTLP